MQRSWPSCRVASRVSPSYRQAPPVWRLGQRLAGLAQGLAQVQARPWVWVWVWPQSHARGLQLSIPLALPLFVLGDHVLTAREVGHLYHYLTFTYPSSRLFTYPSDSRDGWHCRICDPVCLIRGAKRVVLGKFSQLP